MVDIPPIVRDEVVKLVPSSIINEMCCFTFYDNHPCDIDCILDIVICTNKGEIIEFYQRNVVLKILITSCRAKDIQIHRNSIGIHYIVSTESEIFVLKRTQCIEVIRTIENVIKFTLDINMTTGKEFLKVWIEGDAIPIVYNDKFETVLHSLYDEAENVEGDDSISILNCQKSQLIKAKFILSNNEKNIKELVELKKEAAFNMYRKMYPQLEDSIFKNFTKEFMGALRATINTPIVKFCNKKIIIIFNVFNDNKESLDDIEVVIHSNDKTIITYETKMYRNSIETPFWTEYSTKSLQPKEKASLATIIDMKELNNIVAQRIQFDGVIVYKINDIIKLLPFENVNISHMDSMSENYDVLSQRHYDDFDFLTIIASTVHTNLNITSIHTGTADVKLSDLFCKYLKMDNIQTNMVIHRCSPYHILNGVMILCHDDKDDNCFRITIFSRKESQVVALIHYIYDAIPYRLIITLPQTEIILKSNAISIKSCNQSVDKNIKLFDYGLCLKEQMSVVLKFYDECIVKMGQSKCSKVLGDLGSKIDLNAGGKDVKEKFLKELNKTIEDYFEGRLKANIDSDVMEID